MFPKTDYMFFFKERTPQTSVHAGGNVGPGFDFPNYTHTCKTLAVPSSADVIKYLNDALVSGQRTMSQSTVAGKPQQQGI